MAAGPRPYVLLEANLRQLKAKSPQLAVLPWGATEAHNRHLPFGTDVYEAEAMAVAAAGKAHDAGANVAVLPTIPFGNNEQHLDQVSTISITTTTALAILDDVVRSLTSQGIDRLAIVNGHGGNEFKPLVRDLQNKYSVLIVVVNWYHLIADLIVAVSGSAVDHGDDAETSLMLHLQPQLVEMQHAGEGKRIRFDLKQLERPGVWTPRPWAHTNPDTGSGDPREATAEKGARLFAAATEALSEIFVELAQAERGQLPYL